MYSNRAVSTIVGRTTKSMRLDDIAARFVGHGGSIVNLEISRTQHGICWQPSQSVPLVAGLFTAGLRQGASQSSMSTAASWPLPSAIIPKIPRNFLRPAPSAVLVRAIQRTNRLRVGVRITEDANLCDLGGWIERWCVAGHYLQLGNRRFNRIRSADVSQDFHRTWSHHGSGRCAFTQIEDHCRSDGLIVTRVCSGSL